MLSDYGSLLSAPHPFWFASPDLLTSVLASEVTAVSQLLASYPNIRDLFDTPDPTVPERRACFEVLAHRMIMDIIYEMFAARYEQSPSLGNTEANVLSRTQSLVSADAPTWAMEIEKIVAQLPFHIVRALPEPLRTQGYDSNNAEQIATIKAAADTLASDEQIHSLTARVLDEQLLRLQRRWSADTPRVPDVVVRTAVGPNDAASVRPKKRKPPRKRDVKQMFRDKLIAEIAEISKTREEFLMRMDNRNVGPQPTWDNWPGSWVMAYKNPRLRDLIQKDKSRALSRVYSGRYR